MGPVLVISNLCSKLPDTLRTDLYEFSVFPFLLAPRILKKQVDFSSYCIVDVYTAHDPPQNWARK